MDIVAAEEHRWLKSTDDSRTAQTGTGGVTPGLDGRAHTSERE